MSKLKALRKSRIGRAISAHWNDMFSASTTTTSKFVKQGQKSSSLKRELATAVAAEAIIGMFTNPMDGTVDEVSFKAKHPELADLTSEDLKILAMKCLGTITSIPQIRATIPKMLQQVRPILARLGSYATEDLTASEIIDAQEWTTCRVSASAISPDDRLRLIISNQIALALFLNPEIFVLPDAIERMREQIFSDISEILVDKTKTLFTVYTQIYAKVTYYLDLQLNATVEKDVVHVLDVDDNDMTSRTFGFFSGQSASPLYQSDITKIV